MNNDYFDDDIDNHIINFPVAAQGEDEEELVWTWRRVIYLIIALLMIAVFLFYTISPLLVQSRRNPHPPIPTPTQPLNSI